MYVAHFQAGLGITSIDGPSDCDVCAAIRKYKYHMGFALAGYSSKNSVPGNVAPSDLREGFIGSKKIPILPIFPRPGKKKPA